MKIAHKFLEFYASRCLKILCFCFEWGRRRRGKKVVNFIHSLIRENICFFSNECITKYSVAIEMFSWQQLNSSGVHTTAFGYRREMSNFFPFDISQARQSGNVGQHQHTHPRFRYYFIDRSFICIYGRENRPDGEKKTRRKASNLCANPNNCDIMARFRIRYVKR